jgi:hypothetical protein
MARSLTKGFIGWLLRGLLVISGKPFASKAGFVLPTTVLLLLVVTLTVGAIGYRTYTRSQQAIGERQQRVIYNAATPAIDRAKSKLEFLFNTGRDRRFGGVPSEDQLLGMMLNDGTNGIPPYPSGGPDPYTFPEERRIDLNGDGNLDNAWMYEADRDGDGELDSRVAYSIIFDAPEPNEADVALRDSTRDAINRRANRLLIRNAPLSNQVEVDPLCVRNEDNPNAVVPLISERGWFEDQLDTTRLRKNFQVNAYVLPLNPDQTIDPNTTVATLEFQQDREAIQGFKWAAWFRNDLEIFPGPPFNWNGAMHTEGSYFVTGNFRAYMVSSPASCLYREDASRLTNPDIADSADETIPNFQGQFITGSIRDNNFDGNPRFDLWDGEGRPPIPNREMRSSVDSVTNPGNAGPIAFTLDPVRLQTEDVSIGRIVNDPRDNRAGTWENSDFERRMQNLRLSTPYLDDTFRADNRYGPKPRFGYNRELIPNRIGEDIPNNNIELVGDDPVGLDGYWERRARNEGLRLIVGQRLELGDAAGWGGPTTSNTTDEVADLINEPLRPWNGDNCSGTRCNEIRQRRTLSDSLPAVQATAIYHASNNIDFPAACIVSAVHPGTAGTLDKSATFENLAFGFENAFSAPYNGAGTIISDFFRGRGTNGWQYSLPDVGAFSDLNSPLMQALTNLAYFAGDPRGGAPSFTPIQDNRVHPFPYLAMWGDFSMLRRVIQQMQTGRSYDNLSPADKSTLHTAACTMGMLAYNVDYLNRFDFNAVDAATLGTNTANDFNGLRGHIRAIDALIYDPDGTDTNDTGDPVVPATLRSTIPLAIRRLAEADMSTMAWVQGSKSLQSNDPETYIRLMELWRDNATGALKDQLTREIYLAQMIITQQQVARDRKFGFDGSYAQGGTANKFSDQCLAWYNGQDPTRAFKTAALAEPLMRLCSDRPHYPILYSLFPITEHGDVFDAAAPDPTALRDNVRGSVDWQSPQVFQYLRTINQGIRYRVLTDAQINSIAARPLRLSGSTIGFAGQAWTLPVASAGSGNTPNSNTSDFVKVCPANDPCSLPQSASNRIPESGALFRVPFKDSGFMNGRELLSVRALDIDLDLLRTNTAFGDYWLPRTGIVYAFREDAISEAHIVRPANDTWTNCRTEVALRTRANCRMQTGTVSAVESFDPPLSPRAITTKPVDYFPDPDRRPNGFRLRNGAALWRGTASGSTINDDADPPGRGLAFITDNPAYIQGPFNLHRAPGETSLARNQGLEEFTERLDTTNFGNFYTRSTLNEDFAAIANDQWRPAELIADAVTPLSTNFCDGSIEDGLITAAPISNGALSSAFVSDRYGCTGSGSVTSYLNYNRPNAAIPGTSSVKWIRSNLAETLWRSSLTGANAGTAPQNSPDGRGESPIFLTNTGEPTWLNSSLQMRKYTAGYIRMEEAKTLPTAPSGIQMNLIMVSGIVPSREGQAYGGLHNFPRFLENWSSRDLYMSGAFLQLNFSTYGTAPFDQEAWEPGQPDPRTGGGSNEWISYYSPPNRRWGFDVAIKYAPPGPVAERFRSPDPTRSEFYSEPPSDDPYIQLLDSCTRDPGSCRA